MSRLISQNRRSLSGIVLLLACTLLLLLVSSMNAAEQSTASASEQHRSVQDSCNEAAAAQATAPISSTPSSYLPLVQNCGAPAPTPTSTPDPWTAPAAAIEVFSPITNSVYNSPIEVIGYSQTFEGNVIVRLLDATDTVIAERFTIGGSVDGYDFFHTRLRFYIDEQQDGTIEVFESSAADGSEIHKVTIPVILLPGQRTIDLEAPAVGQSVVCSPVNISGYSNTFEANVVAELQTRSSTLITMTTTMGGNLGFFDYFSTALAHDVGAPEAVLAGVYGGEGQGLGPLDHTRVPVSLYPCP